MQFDLIFTVPVTKSCILRTVKDLLQKQCVLIFFSSSTYHFLHSNSQQIKRMLILIYFAYDIYSRLRLNTITLKSKKNFVSHKTKSR